MSVTVGNLEQMKTFLWGARLELLVPFITFI